MQDDQQKQPDPAAIWWGSSRSEPPPLEPLPPQPPELWRWSWSPLVGIKYGPIPVGLIVALPILIGIYAR
jgi:hypothetical protein